MAKKAKKLQLRNSDSLLSITTDTIATLGKNANKIIGSSSDSIVKLFEAFTQELDGFIIDRKAALMLDAVISKRIINKAEALESVSEAIIALEKSKIKELLKDNSNEAEVKKYTDSISKLEEFYDKLIEEINILNGNEEKDEE